MFRLNIIVCPFLRKFRSISRYNNQSWAVSEDGVVKFMSLTKESLDGAIKVMRESFLLEENLCKAVGLLNEPGAADEIIQTCYDTARDGVSIVAHDSSTEKIVGVIFNKIQLQVPKGQSYYERFSKTCKYKASKAIIDFTIDIDGRADLFKRYDTNCLLEIMYIAALPQYRQNKIAQLLVTGTMRLAEELKHGRNAKTLIDSDEFKDIANIDSIPSLVSGLVTSNYSQKLGVKFGFDKIVEVNYDDFTIDDRKFSQRIGNVHKTCQVVAKRVNAE